MLTVVLLSLLVIVCLVKAVRDRIKEAYEHILPPAHPGELPIIGHAHCLLGDTKRMWYLVQLVADRCVQLGGVIYTKIGSDIYYVVTDPDDALTVSNSCPQKHYIYTFTKNWLGHGLVTGTGEVYKSHRKMINPAHTTTVVHDYLSLFNSQSRKLVTEMNAHSAQGPFDPVPLFTNFVLETICFTTFGSRMRDKDFTQTFMKTLDQLMNMWTQRFQSVHLHFDFCFKFSGLRKKQELLAKTMNKLITEIIEQRKAIMKNEETIDKSYSQGKPELQFKPLVDRLIELSRDGQLTEDEVREEAGTNIAAGFETTAYTLVHIAVLLGTYPNVQEKLYSELIEVLGEDKDVNKDDLQKLVYTKAVIKETLRVIPTVPAVLRYVDRDVNLKNYTLRKNSQCAIFPIGMHRNAAWGPDADQFKPERWLDAATLPANANCFAGFSLGKRSCIGMSSATTSLTVILAHLVRRYKWTADASKLEMKLDITLKPTAGQEINIQRRKNI